MKGTIAKRIALFAGVMLLIAPALGAQTRAEKDSINAHASAVNQLRLFEFRYNTLVRVPGARNMAPLNPVFAACEIRIGDYCYGPRNGGLVPAGIGTRADSRASTPANFSKVFHKRSTAYINMYVNDLSGVRKKIPGDRWLNGEIVRAEVERGNVVKAMESLDKCRAEAWWCAALKAYVIHVGGMWRRADSAWTQALALMPLEERCAWMDPTWLVTEEEFVEKYRGATCAERLTIASRFWWLSDPLYSIDGNERRSEHLSRVVELLLVQGYRQHRVMTPAMAAREKGPSLGRPMPIPSAAASSEESVGAEGGTGNGLLTLRFGYPEVVMRLGAPQWTAREEGSISTVALYPTSRVAFAPRGNALLSHVHADAESWELHAPDAFEFMSSWPQPMREVEYQVAHFRRGDSSAVVAAVDVSRDSVLAYVEFMASATMQRDYDAAAEKAEKIGVNQVRFQLTTARDSTLYGIELLNSSGATGRARFGSGPPVMPNQRVTLSDVLLMEPGEPMPAGLDDAGARALGTTRIRTESTVGIYWETYGLQKDEKPSVSIVVVPDRPGLAERIARAITLQRSSDSISVTIDPVPANGSEIDGRSVNLDLRTLSTGKYTLSLVVEVDGLQRVVSRRRLEIREPERMRFP